MSPKLVRLQPDAAAPPTALGLASRATASPQQDAAGFYRRRSDMPDPYVEAAPVAGDQHHDLAGERHADGQEHRQLRASSATRHRARRLYGDQLRSIAAVPGWRLTPSVRLSNTARRLFVQPVDLHRGTAVPGASRRRRADLAGRRLLRDERPDRLHRLAIAGVHRLHRIPTTCSLHRPHRRAACVNYTRGDRTRSATRSGSTPRRPTRSPTSSSSPAASAIPGTKCAASAAGSAYRFPLRRARCGLAQLRAAMHAALRWRPAPLSLLPDCSGHSTGELQQADLADRPRLQADATTCCSTPSMRAAIARAASSPTCRPIHDLLARRRSIPTRSAPRRASAARVRGNFNIAASTTISATSRSSSASTRTRPSPISVTPDRRAVNVGKSRIWGIELDARLNLFEGFALERRLHLSQHQGEGGHRADAAGQQPLYGLGPAQPGDELILSPKHKLTVTAHVHAAAGRERGQGLGGGTDLHYISRQRTTYALRDPAVSVSSAGVDIGVLQPRNCSSQSQLELASPARRSTSRLFVTNLTNEQVLQPRQRAARSAGLRNRPLWASRACTACGCATASAATEAAAPPGEGEGPLAFTSPRSQHRVDVGGGVAFEVKPSPLRLTRRPRLTPSRSPSSAAQRPTLRSSRSQGIRPRRHSLAARESAEPAVDRDVGDRDSRRRRNSALRPAAGRRRRRCAWSPSR